MIELIKEFGMAILWLISRLGCKKEILNQSVKKPNLGRGCMNW